MIKLCLDLLLKNLCVCHSWSLSMVKLSCVEGLHYFLRATKGIELITKVCSESHRKLNKLFFTRDEVCFNCLQIYFV